MAQDRNKRDRVAFILGQPELFPDEFKAWIPRSLAINPNFRLAQTQLPTVEPTHYIGADGEVTFSGTWVNYGSGFEEAGYYKDPFGIVHLCGFIKSGTLNTVAFTLPGGYRPKAREVFPADVNSNAHGRLDVTAAGDVIPVAGSATYFSISGITFRAFS